MLVGLLAKLVAALIFVLVVVGVFVGGEKLVSVVDKARGPAPPTAVRAVPESVPHTPYKPLTQPSPTRKSAPSVAVLTPTQPPPGPAAQPPRPKRGAL
ncbi:MAG TPA: hypothetical protein PKA66_13245, partial [Gemmatimonadales bacterium]|nr:hypothetical protein [Gemmatimonadales bacterium]